MLPDRTTTVSCETILPAPGLLVFTTRMAWMPIGTLLKLNGPVVSLTDVSAPLLA